ncbi:hypothetical protein ZEAMMB73_Zm00001d032220 [Zea mays]|uniref:Uncharacterized protein n=1 Tax=Zea mays TaxID=4577 RepID=A0A1D6KP93_MAIZE|nr:hypothetical protein ZEAMMB73_Zm00001d032220 [Zea mays]ONM04619.1 hypothetical protein ZEAMMB73_Zm00001d032220 [Zea mays]ONM04626.1 hypothetical protein ZEAMMB73_Zm00001d032220 [Zea mays]ONM04627.1 hypothetical protein ZEAMMB73_Zm00001d032220 [Zea mays]ONM04630.1 hypothetical protein ZEAMMB73_Zm00001d032220 [Zea mays]
MRSSRRCAACRGFLQGGEHGGGARSSRGTDQEHWRGEEIEEALCFLGVPRQQLGAACIDHRGTPEHPARTCTLETDDEAMLGNCILCQGWSRKRAKSNAVLGEKRV